MADSGFVARDTGIADATGGVASVIVARPQGPLPRAATTHGADILFTFVLAGALTLDAAGQGSHALEEGDAYVVLARARHHARRCHAGSELLEVSLPALGPSPA